MARRRRVAAARGIAFRAHHVVQRRREVGVREPFRDDAVDDPIGFLRSGPGFHLDDRPDANAGLGGGPKVELMRSRGSKLGSDYAPNRWSI